MFSEFKHLYTEDYQRRGDEYPRSGLPDCIHVYDDNISFGFKNTSQLIAEKWVKSFCVQNSIQFNEIFSVQEGDYHDDWVGVVIK